MRLFSVAAPPRLRVSLGLGDLHFSLFRTFWLNSCIHLFIKFAGVSLASKMSLACLLWDKRQSKTSTSPSPQFSVFTTPWMAFTRTRGSDKFSHFIPLHIALIDSSLLVMMCSVSDRVAHSSRPWKSFDVCFVWNAYMLLYIRRDISCIMFRLFVFSFSFSLFHLWKKETIELETMNLHWMSTDCWFNQSINQSVIVGNNYISCYKIKTRIIITIINK